MNKFTLTVIAFCILVIGLEVAVAQQNFSSQDPHQPNVAQPLLRTVKGQVLTSRETPAVRLEFDNRFKYAGGQTFILYDVARAEQHFFVDADAEGKVKRLYWVQFEGYLPNNTHTYRYQPIKTVQIGGLSFIADAMARKIQAGQSRPNSDGSRAQTFLESKGYRLEGNEVLVQRLVHLIDESKRNELMIIYAEDLGGTGLTSADLAPNGSARDRWEEIQKGLLERATKGLKISQ